MPELVTPTARLVDRENPEEEPRPATAWFPLPKLVIPIQSDRNCQGSAMEKTPIDDEVRITKPSGAKHDKPDLNNPADPFDPSPNQSAHGPPVAVEIRRKNPEPRTGYETKRVGLNGRHANSRISIRKVRGRLKWYERETYLRCHVVEEPRARKTIDVWEQYHLCVAATQRPDTACRWVPFGTRTFHSVPVRGRRSWRRQ